MKKSKKIVASIMFFLMLLTVISPYIDARSAYMWGENTNRTRNIGESIPTNYDNYRTFSSVKATQASPIIVEMLDGKSIMFIKDSEKGYVYAFDVDTQTQLWRSYIGDTAGQPSTPMYYGKRKGDENNPGYNGKNVVFVASGKYIFALDATNGGELGRRVISVTGGNNAVGSHPLVVSDKYLYIGSRNGRFFGWDITNSLNPVFSPINFNSGWVSAAPTKVGDKIVIGTDSSPGKVYVLSQTGSILKAYTTKGGVTGSAIALGSSSFFIKDKLGNAYTGTTSGTFTLINGKLGTGRNKSLNPPALGDGYVYFTVNYDSNNNGHIYGVGINSSNKGELIHLYEADNPIVSAPTITGDAIFFAESDGSIIAIQQRTGDPFEWYNGSHRAQTSGTQLFSSVTIGGGKHKYITIATDDGINVFAPKLPNLTITDFIPASGTYNVDQNVTYSVKIINNGPADVTKPFKIRIYKNSIADRNALGEASLSSLLRNQLKIVSITFAYQEPGDFKLVAFVDAEKQIEETDEKDNTAEATVTVERVVPVGSVVADFNINPNPAGIDQEFKFEDLSEANGDTIKTREWSMTVGTTNYAWTTDVNGTVLSGTRPSKISIEGVYPVTLKLTTDGGKTATKLKDLEITYSPPEMEDRGLPPIADFDLVNPIWTDDPVEVEDKSYDEDGEIIASSWVHAAAERYAYDEWAIGLPPTDLPGKFVIRRYVMDNDYNLAYRDKELEILEKIPTTELIPGSEYAYPTETMTPFPYEADISDSDYRNLSYLLPSGFPIWDYEVRANEKKIILFKKNDYRLWEIRDKQLVEVTPTNFYQAGQKKLVIKDIQLVGDSVLVTGYYLYWGHYYVWAGDSWNYNDGTLIQYTPTATTKPNLVMDFVSLRSWDWGYYGDDVSLGIGIRNYSLKQATGTINIKVTPYIYSYNRNTGGSLSPAGVRCWEDYWTGRTICKDTAQTKTVSINLPPLGTANFQYDFYGDYDYYDVEIDTTNAISEISESDNSVWANGGRLAQADPWRYGNTGEIGISENLNLSFYPDYMTYEQYDNSTEYNYNKKMYDITTAPNPEKTQNLLIELNSSFQQENAVSLKNTRETNNMMIKNVDDRKAIIVYDWKDTSQLITDKQDNYGTVATGTYDVASNTYSEVHKLSQQGIIEVSSLFPISWSGNMVWSQMFESNGYKGMYFTIKGPADTYGANLLDFQFNGDYGWYLAKVKQRYYSTYPYSVQTTGDSSERVSGENLVAVKMKYDKNTGQFTFDDFNQSGSLNINNPHPYKYRDRIVDPNSSVPQYNEILPNRSGFLSYSKNSYNAVDAKDNPIDTGTHDAFFGLGYMVAHAIGLLPSQLGSIKYITGVGNDDYSLLYINNSSTGKNHLLAYNGLSIIEFDVQGLPTGTDIKKMGKMMYNGIEYVYIIGNASGKPIFFIFDAPDNLFNVPQYFATNLQYQLPVGVHLFHNQFVQTSNIESALKNSNYTVKVTQKLFDGTTKTFDSFALTTQTTEMADSSKGSKYLYFYRPFMSDKEAEYTVELNVNPKRTILEQNYLKQPLYGNNIATTKFLTIDIRKPTLAMSRTKLYKDRDTASKSSTVSWQIFQTPHSFQKYNIIMRNKANGKTKLFYTSTSLPYLGKGSTTYSNDLDDLGNYQVYIEVFTKYNLVLRSAPVDFQILNSSAPTAVVTVPLSSDPNNPTIVYTKRPTIKWNYYDADGDTQTRAYINIDKPDTWYSDVIYQLSGSAKESTVNTDLVDGATYSVMVKPYDQYKEGPWSAVKYLKIIANRPPVANFTWTPSSAIWEGDTINLINQSTDPDTGDRLSYLWTIKSPDGKATTSTLTDPVVPRVKSGTYIITLKVTDLRGFTNEITKSITVRPLIVEGYVRHTLDWNNHRMDYNRKQTGNPETPRSYSTFWAGEKFVLETTTSETATKLKVEMNFPNVGERAYTLIPNPRTNQWTGSAWEEVFVNIPDGSYSIRFTATYSNGMVKEDTVQINISGNVMELPKVHRIH